MIISTKVIPVAFLVIAFIIALSSCQEGGGVTKVEKIGEFNKPLEVKQGVITIYNFKVSNNEELSVEVLSEADFKLTLKNADTTRPEDIAKDSAPSNLPMEYFFFDYEVDNVVPYNIVFNYKYNRVNMRQLGYEEDTLRMCIFRGSKCETFSTEHRVDTITRTISQGSSSQRDLPFQLSRFAIVGKEEEFAVFGKPFKILQRKDKITTVLDEDENRIGLKTTTYGTQGGQVTISQMQTLIPDTSMPAGTIDLDGTVGFRVETNNDMKARVQFEWDIQEAGRDTKINQILADTKFKIMAMMWTGSGYTYLKTERKGNIVIFQPEFKGEAHVFVLATDPDVKPGTQAGGDSNTGGGSGSSDTDEDEIPEEDDNQNTNTNSGNSHTNDQTFIFQTVLLCVCIITMVFTMI